MKLIRAIAKLFGFCSTVVDSKVNDLYTANPDVVLKQLEDNKDASLKKIKDSAVNFLTITEGWKDELDELDKKVKSLDSRIIRAKNIGDMDTAKSLAAEWKTTKEKRDFYAARVDEASTQYNKILETYRARQNAFDSKIDQVKMAIAKLTVNKEVAELNAILSGVGMKDSVLGIDINELTDAIDAKNIEIESETKVIDDLELNKSVEDIEVDTESAYEEWMKSNGN